LDSDCFREVAFTADMKGFANSFLEQDEFWLMFELCQKNLPEQQAQIFMLREMVGLEADEICQDMNISPSACRVYLHRARLGLRECLEQRWFNTQRAL